MSELPTSSGVVRLSRATGFIPVVLLDHGVPATDQTGGDEPRRSRAMSASLFQFVARNLRQPNVLNGAHDRNLALAPGPEEDRVGPGR